MFLKSFYGQVYIKKQRKLRRDFNEDEAEMQQNKVSLHKGHTSVYNNDTISLNKGHMLVYNNDTRQST